MPQQLTRDNSCPRGVALGLFALLCGGAGCALNSASEARECYSLDDCGSEQICFLGTCVDPGFSIQSVHAELMPPNNSSYLPQQLPVSLDLASGFQTLTLQEAVTLSGTVATGEGVPVPGSLVAVGEGSIPGRDVTSEVQVTSTDGFLLRVIAGTYDLHFTPYDVAAGDALGRPPVAYAAQPILDSHATELDYPTYPDEMVTVGGRVRYASTSPTGVEGALVSATAQDSQGHELLSSEDITDAAGDFVLVFPPGAELFTITVRGTELPEITVQRSAGSTLPLGVDDIILGVQPKVSVAATVQDANGAPVPEASVVFKGTVSDLGSTYTTQRQSKSDGSLDPPDLYPGDYDVTVIPLKAQPYATTSAQLVIGDSQNAPLVLTVGRKVRLFGHIASHDGSPVDAARVVAKRAQPSQRTFSTTTLPDGSYELAVDPGSDAEPADYELVVEPDAASGLPRQRSRLRVGAGDLQQDITLYRSTFVYGKVLDADGAPLAQVTIAFYSLELGSPTEALLVGLGQTNASGEFAVPLPTLE